MSALALPLVSATLAFLAGLLAGLRVEGVPVAIALAALPLLASPWLHRRAGWGALPPRTVHALLLGALAVAGAAHGAGARERGAADCRHHLPEGAEVVLRATLAASWTPETDPRARRPLLPASAAEVRVGGSALRGCRGEVRVRLPRGTAPLDAGTELELRGRWARLPRPVLAGAWPPDPRFAGYLAADSASILSPPRWIAHPLLRARGGAERRLERLTGRHAPLAHALLLGRRETLDPEVRDRFARAGLAHLLAISGMHVGIVGGTFVLLGRAARLSRRRVAVATIVLIAVYLAVIGAPPSALRAGIMLSLALLAGTLQRPTAALAGVSAAALALLAVQPRAALDIGFQLSFAGVLGIVLLRPPVLAAIPLRWRKGPAGRWTAESLAVSLAAFAATAPAVAHHFGVVAPVSILASVPAAPMTGFAVVGIGAAAVLEPVAPALAGVVADGAGVGLDALDRLVELSLRVPGASRSVPRPLWWVWGVAGASRSSSSKRDGDSAPGRAGRSRRWSPAPSGSSSPWPTAWGRAGWSSRSSTWGRGTRSPSAPRRGAGSWWTRGCGTRAGTRAPDASSPSCTRGEHGGSRRSSSPTRTPTTSGAPRR